MKNFLTKIKSDYLWSAVAALSILLYAASVVADFSLGMLVFGLPILFYFPGRFIIDIWPRTLSSSGAFGRFSYSVIYSFCISAFSAHLITQAAGMTSPWKIWFILILNGVLLIMRSWLKRDSNKGEKLVWADFIPPAILLFAMTAVVALNPYAQNLDNYLNILLQSISTGSNLLYNRKIFVSSLGLFDEVLGIDTVLIYRHLLPMLFIASTLSLYDYLRRQVQTRLTVAVCYLMLLAAPAILTEVNRVMPQVVLLSTTIPILLLLASSLKERRVLPAIIAIAISVISLLFHELSAILLFVSIVVLGMNLWRFAFVDKKLSSNFWWVSLSALAIAISLKPIFFWSILERPFTRFILGFGFVRGQGGLTWKWWFINNYKTIEDTQLGWTGIGALYYYMYGGILILVFLVCLYLYMRSKKVETGLYILPIGLHFYFYFFAAEIMPRLNYAFLPNRAWVHMMLSGVILIVLVVEKLEAKKLRIKFLLTIAIAMILTGYAGTLYLAKNYIYEIYPDEIPAAKFLRENTAPNSLVLSSQSNMSLVSIYGKRQSGYVFFDLCINKQGFVKGINKTLDALAKESLIAEPQFLQASANYYRTKSNPEFLTSKKFNDGSNEVYFLYSYRKVGGLNNQREYRQGVVDAFNASSYKNLGLKVAYEDSEVIILRVR